MATPVEQTGSNQAAPAAAAPFGDSLAAGQLDTLLQQSLSGLQRLEELQRLALETTHLTIGRIGELHQRANRASWAEMESELFSFHAAATIRFWQQLVDIGLRDLNARMLQLAGNLDFAKAGLQASDFGLLLGLLHTGIGPIDDLLGASLKRQLLPPLPD